MYIKRILEDTIKKYLRTKEVIAVIGPRQCGKTTLLKEVYTKLSNALFIDFEDREILQLFKEDIKAFAKLYVEPYDYIFIDEFQYAKEGGQRIKYLFDHYKTKIIISGSSATGLSIHGIKYLVG